MVARHDQVIDYEEVDPYVRAQPIERWFGLEKVAVLRARQEDELGRHTRCDRR
jgi:hypothetical protein